MTQWIVLSCLIYHKNQGHIFTLLRKEYFLEDLPLKVFLYLQELFNNGISIEKELIVSKFPNITTELDVSVDYDNYEEYIKTLRNQYISREIKKLGRVIESRTEIDEERFIQYVDGLINKFNEGKTQDSTFTAEIVAEQFYKDAQSENTINNEIIYGIDSVDKFTGGLTNGESHIIAGRPSIGKSQVLGHIAMSNAIRGYPTILFSLEMNEKQIIKRMFSDYCGVPLWKFKNIKSRSPEEQSRFKLALEKFKQMPLIINTNVLTTSSDIISLIQNVKIKYGKISLVVVDYLQLMASNGENENIRIANLSRIMKHIAKQFNIPVVTGSQLNRTCEQRDNKRPILSDMRDSGAIEQDADVVCAVYRDHYYNYNPEHERLCELLFRKNRNGEIGKVIIDYDLKTQNMKSIDPNSALGKTAKRFEYE
jgi:replicative DNA helicase